MTLDRDQIRNYFSPPADSYWQWQEQGRVVAWSDGITICYREQLRSILNRLAAQGLPPLGSILLLMAACRDNWAEEDRGAFLVQHLGEPLAEEFRELAADVVAGLDAIHSVGREYNGEPLQIEPIAAWIFDGVAGRYTSGVSEQLAQHFSQGLSDEDRLPRRISPLEAMHDLGCLRQRLGGFDPQSVDLFRKTGLDDIPQAATLEPPPPASARDLINTLQDDPDLGAVARLAQLLLAAVHLPRAISDPDELPIGGVSDIVNRGPLDRLLLSELAHDDLTLSVRVAMNEALFLRRESPPRTPPRGRRVLLDAGIRTWGVPRVFVSAVGLALAAQSDEKLHVSTFSAAGGDAEPVDFTTQDGLTRHLATLDHRLHPAESLLALSPLSPRGRGAGGEGADSPADIEEHDLVLVTTDDTLADRDFQRELHAAGPLALYIATVNRDGHFQLVQKSFRGSKLLRQAKFDLGDVLKPRPRRPKLLDKSHDRELPAFFAQESVPLRLSAPVEFERSWLVHPGTVLTYTRDGRLLLWDSPQHAARQIAESLPEGSLLWCDSEWKDDTLQLVIGKRSHRGLRAVTYDRRAGELHIATLKLTGEQPQAVSGQRGYAYVFYSHGFDVLSLATGELEVNHPLRSYPGVKSLFFPRDESRRYRRWAMLSHFPDSHVNFQQPIFHETEQVQLIGMTHCVGHEGPLGITTSGNILDPATGRLTSATTSHWPASRQAPMPPYNVAGISRDGQRAMLRRVNGGNDISLLLHLPSGKLDPLYVANAYALEQPLFDLARPRNLRSRFTAIGIARDREIALISRRDQPWPIVFEVGQRTIRFPKTPLTGLLLEKVAFARLEEQDRGYTLDVAQWPDGSRAWLDSRGLLHLQSSDRAIPQCTLILTDGPMAGWLEDGSVFGPDYWLQGQRAISEREVFHEVLRKFAARIG
jgi:hypothetical protein